MSTDILLYSVERSVARITLNRPDRLNAINPDLSEAMDAAFAQAAADPDVRVILLSGTGKGFCAGADTQVLDTIAGQAKSREGQEQIERRKLRYDDISLLPKPVIAAVHGACAGVGLSIACAADVRIASTAAFFVAPFVKLGLCAETGLAWHLPRLIGSGHAAEFLLSGRRIPAEEAMAKGLVSLVMPEQGFAEAALDYAAAMARGSSPSFAMMKAQLREAQTQDFEAARESATALTKSSLKHPDFREANAARKERRAAKFEPLSADFAPPIIG